MAPQAQSRDTSWNLLAQAMGPWVWDCAEGLCQRLCQDCAGFLPLASCLLRGWKHSETPTVSLAFLFLLCFSLGMKRRPSCEVEVSSAIVALRTARLTAVRVPSFVSR